MATRYKIYNILSFVWFSSISFLVFITPTLAQTDSYIVHMDLSAMPKAFSSHHSWYLATLSSAFAVSKRRNTVSTDHAAPFSATLLYTYTHVINGFSAYLSLSELEALKNSPGYISSIKDLPVKLDTTHSPKFLGLTGNPETWQSTNYGEGIIIVVDTGIWPESESHNDKGIPKRWKMSKWHPILKIGVRYNS